MTRRFVTVIGLALLTAGLSAQGEYAEGLNSKDVDRTLPVIVQDARGAVEYEGTFSATGTSPAGDYTASVEITKHGPVYEIQWTFPQGDGMAGVGFVQGDRFVVGFAVMGPFGAAPGVVSYRVTNKQPLTLEGQWTGFGHMDIDTEKLIKGPPAIRAAR